MCNTWHVGMDIWCCSHECLTCFTAVKHKHTTTNLQKCTLNADKKRKRIECLTVQGNLPNETKDIQQERHWCLKVWNQVAPTGHRATPTLANIAMHVLEPFWCNFYQNKNYTFPWNIVAFVNLYSFKVFGTENNHNFLIWEFWQFGAVCHKSLFSILVWRITVGKGGSGCAEMLDLWFSVSVTPIYESHLSDPSSWISLVS